MADADASAPLNQDECREPALEDLVKLCQALNQAGAHYLVIGGFAMRAAGFIRNTMDRWLRWLGRLLNGKTNRP